MDIEYINGIFKNREPEYIGRHACFSVIVPMIKTDSGIEILFEKRSSSIRRQPGEICFPGGMKEHDETDLECALRETSEELGIREDDIKSCIEIGTLNTYGGYIIKVYTGEITADVLEKAVPSPDEVEELFKVPLEFFLNTEPDVYDGIVTSRLEDDFPLDLVGFPHGYPWKKVKNDIPVYVYDNYVIWGITGRIIKYFADVINDQN